jgi:hypothetical protein
MLDSNFCEEMREFEDITFFQGIKACFKIVMNLQSSWCAEFGFFVLITETTPFISSLRNINTTAKTLAPKKVCKDVLI